MNNYNTTTTTNLEEQTYTDLAPRTFTQACADKLQSLKAKLVAKLTAEFSDLHEGLIRRAVDDADALATLSGFPHLLLPDLALEKVQGARTWNQRQQMIQQGVTVRSLNPKQARSRIVRSQELAFAGH